ncbi:MAG: eukaryotic-like serine/threonine-protein kinase, partial [Verrucomicrobiota bacterium]
RQVIARFEAERQALALMDHPNIAKVLDAGATETGRPYFVMELVRGVKITDYCDEAKLSTSERLDLFIEVCHAIQHAHQKGVIHRDIKPSNILVTVNDGVAVPKVIDFGIAKATNQQPLTDKTVFTAFEQFIGTPAYMSPEQAVMTSLDVDTRSDIYSLGVLLYELLTGKTPLDQKELLAAGMDEMRRTIREREPARPSTRVSTMLEGELTTTAKHRHTDALKLIHLLRGDLDWIVMKTLEKDRARRYQTANDLASDVQRHLDNEPVVARPPSKLYRCQKLARRNKLAFAAAAAVLVALVAGLVVATWFFMQEKEARRRATAAEKQAQAINRFLTEDLLFQATPEQNAREKKVTMEEVLNVATSNLDHNAEIAREPALEATLRLDIGTTYEKLGVLGEAERNLRIALKLCRSALGPKHLETLAAQHALATLLSGQRKHEESERLAYEAWQGRLRLLGAEHRDTLSSQELYSEALAEQGKLQEAEPIARQTLQIRERVLGPNDPATISSLGNLGELLELRGSNAEAEPYIREALTRYQRNGFADTQDAFICVKEVAYVRLLQGDPAEAHKLLEEALPRAIKRRGPDDFLTLFIQRVLVRALAEEGRLVEAETLGKETLNARLRTRANQDDVGTARTLLYLGRVLVEESKLDEAEPLLQEALTTFRKDASIKPRPELAAQAANWLGAIQLARKAYPEAEKLMLPGCERFFAANVEMTPNELRVAVGHIVNLYQAWGKPEQTAAWQKKLDQLAKK